MYATELRTRAHRQNQGRKAAAAAEKEEHREHEDCDCGCGHHRTEHRRLACLRLDDMAEFYVGGVGEGTS